MHSRENSDTDISLSFPIRAYTAKQKRRPSELHAHSLDNRPSPPRGRLRLRRYETSSETSKITENKNQILDVAAIHSGSDVSEGSSGVDYSTEEEVETETEQNEEESLQDHGQSRQRRRGRGISSSPLIWIKEVQEEDYELDGFVVDDDEFD